MDGSIRRGVLTHHAIPLPCSHMQCSANLSEWGSVGAMTFKEEFSVLKLTGHSNGYFAIHCADCNQDVELSNLRWEGGTMYVDAACLKCSKAHTFKLHSRTWGELVP